MMGLLTAEKIADLRLKHLEMLQAVIARTANHGATLKNYCITLTTAVSGLAITTKRPLVAALAFLPVVAFAFLDAQYLRIERRFRALFNGARQEDWNSPPTFEIDLGKAPKMSLWPILFSWSVFSFYGALALGVGAVLIIMRILYEPAI